MHEKERNHCIAACLECHRICLETIQYCLSRGGMHAELEHQTVLHDCAQICLTSADFMIRNSPRHELTCMACAEVCRQCAEDCTRMGDDAQMRRCAEMCRLCADDCEQMRKAA